MVAITEEERKFISPKLPAFEGLQLPIGQNELYARLDADPQPPRETIGFIVRERYKYTASVVDGMYYAARHKLLKKPTQQTHYDFVQAVGRVGWFNYGRGMEVVKRDRTIDHTIAPLMSMSPSSAVQTLRAANVSTRDHVLELFAGVGYFSLPLSIERPARLDCVDLITPSIYDLTETQRRAHWWIYGTLRPSLQPKVTPPHFIQEDSKNLDFTNDARFARDGYDKVFLHPPFGRESQRLIPINELQAFVLWLRSLQSVTKANPKSFTSYSVVPTEWMETINQARENGWSLIRSLDDLSSRLAKNKYYQEKRKKVPQLSTAKDIAGWDSVLGMFNKTKEIPQYETRMFPLRIVKMRSAYK